MFEMAFSEIIVVFVVLLLVVGPDRLPGLVRTVGMWIGRARRLVNDVQRDMEQEANRLDSLRKSVEDPVNDFQKMMQQTSKDIQNTTQTATRTDIKGSEQANNTVDALAATEAEARDAQAELPTDSVIDTESSVEATMEATTLETATSLTAADKAQSNSR